MAEAKRAQLHVCYEPLAGAGRRAWAARIDGLGLLTAEWDKGAKREAAGRRGIIAERHLCYACRAEAGGWT